MSKANDLKMDSDEGLSWRAMPVESRGDPIADLKVRIIRQQELAAGLARNDHKHRARLARNKLFGLLNELDLMQDGLTALAPSSIAHTA